MLLAFLAVASIADWVPARWSSADPASLDLVKSTRVNCLLLEQSSWKPEFSEAAEKAGIATLGVIRPGADVKDLAARVRAARLTGVVAEGDLDPALLAPLRDSRIPVVMLGPRTKMKFDGADPVIGTHQGVWAGINEAEEGSAKAAPSGGPWIDTNAGFLRFARSLTGSAIWIANVPPKGKVFPAARYMQAIGDAAMSGARWVIALDADLDKRLQAREEKALTAWKQIAAVLDFYESHADWRKLPTYGKLALVQEVDSGGLISGGVLDMISVKHTPVKPVPGRKLAPSEMEGAKMAVNVDPAAMTDAQQEILRGFTRGGGTLLTAPPGWKFPPQRADQITLDRGDIEKLDAIWKDINSMTGRHNLGARLFNVSSMLSNLLGPASGKPLVLLLVNYSDYAVENVTVHLLGKYAKVRFLEPGAKERVLATYEQEDGTGLDIDKVSTVAALIIE